MTTAEVAEQFRLALRAVATPVTVIATRHRGSRYGMTASAVVPVSMEPPSLLVCVNRTASSYEALIAAGAFTVNFLAADNAALCEAFSRVPNGEQRFAHGRWEDGTDGLPYLADAQSAIGCSLVQRVEHGTHDVLVGTVREVRRRAGVAPLLWVDGGLAAVAGR